MVVDAERIGREDEMLMPEIRNRRLAGQRDRALQVIRDAATLLSIGVQNSDSLTLAADKVAAPVRRLLLESAPLLRGAQLHPLYDATSLVGGIYKNGHYGFRVVASDGSSSGGNYEIQVHPLHGLRHVEDNWIMEPLFDLKGKPMKLKRWLRQELLCVDGRSYDLEQVLRFFVNRNSLHNDTKKDAKALQEREDMEHVNVRTVYYPALVTLFTATYVVGFGFQATVPADQGTDCNPFGMYGESKGTGVRIAPSEGDRPMITSPWDVSTVTVVRAA